MKYPELYAYLPFGAWYETIYVVFAVTATGVTSVTSSQPEAVSFVKSAVASNPPALVHKCPVCKPVFVVPL